jgi:hypothetical protein
MSGLTRKILWTRFKTNGRVNRHTYDNWSNKYTKRMVEEELNVPKLTVWAGM